MKETILIAGFGGQGIILLCMLIAHIAVWKEGYQVTMLPSSWSGNAGMVQHFVL